MNLKLTSSQMRDPVMKTDQGFANWFVDEWMPEYLPDYMTGQSREMLIDMTLSARGYARHFGIHDVDSQLAFVLLCWDMGPGFFLFPGFQEIVRNPDLTGPQKIDAIERVDEDLAVEAFIGRNSSHWFDAPLPPMARNT